MAKPWHPYEQNFINHPKFLVLSAGAVCLWLEGKNYCDMHLTDGMIPREALRTFRFNTRARVEELMQRIDGYSGSLWEVILIDGRDSQIGFRMHDYLNHNPCRDEVVARINRADETAKRKKSNQKAWRDRQRDSNVTGNASVSRVSPLPDKQKQLQKQKHVSPKEQEIHTSLAERMHDAFRGAWGAAYGEPCALMLSNLQTLRLLDVLEELGEFKFLDCVRGYFATKEPFVVNAKHPIGLLLKDPTRYLPVTAKARPAGCRHTPPCVDDVAHTKRDQRERMEAAS